MINISYTAYLNMNIKVDTDVNNNGFKLMNTLDLNEDEPSAYHMEKYRTTNNDGNRNISYFLIIKLFIDRSASIISG